LLALALAFLTLGMMPARSAASPSGNPLWAVPMQALSATRDRPIFSPSRRPPSPPAIVQAAPAPPPPSPKPAEPERPPLSILGTVVGRDDGIAIFMEDAGKNVLRLHAGQDYAGWVLRTVERREVKFVKGTTTARLSLPAAREEPAAAPTAGAPPGERQRSNPAAAAVAQVAASPVVLPERRRRD
jgi:general secretion pathway protein N